MKASTALKKARQLITPPDAWIQGSMYGTADGIRLNMHHDISSCRRCIVCYCADGALLSVVPPDRDWRHSAFAYLYQALPFPKSCDRLEAIADFNDRSTHEEVLAAFDRAIEEALEEGK